jgi:hypothetical protein
MALFTFPKSTFLILGVSSVRTCQETSALSVIASSAPSSGRSPWMKRVFRFSVYSGRFSRADASSLRSSQWRSRSIGGRGWEGANGGGIKAPSKPFSKLLQKSRVLLQAFPNKSLAVFWDFRGLQGFQTSFDVFQIFLLRPPFSAVFLDAAGPHSAASLGARPAARRRNASDDFSLASSDFKVLGAFLWPLPTAPWRLWNFTNCSKTNNFSTSS